MSDQDTIAAIATAPGRSGIGVIRVSGPAVRALIESITGRDLPPRRAVLTDFRGAGGEAIDRGIALFFPAPRSYTGEDLLELQGHGGPIVLRELLCRCLELGARAARPGEFTERAFLNDKLDLAQAESVADLIDAATAQAARGALRSLRGEFSQRVEELVRALKATRALVEATLDFPDEEIDFLKQADAEARLAALRVAVRQVLAATRQGSLLREGVRVVLAGEPNVGKSSLLNRLAGEELAIVTDIPGTTRDAIRLAMDFDGVPVHVIDTAGLRESIDPIEKIGVSRSWELIGQGDVIVLMQEADGAAGATGSELLRRLPSGIPRILVMNKIDLAGREPAWDRRGPNSAVWMSAKTGAGVGLLKQAILAAAGWENAGEGLFMARTRHVQALVDASEYLKHADTASGRLELLAEDLRLAQQSLEAITGACTSDELLGEIFSRFCIGK